VVVLVTGSGTLLGNEIAKSLLKKNIKIIAAFRKTFPENFIKFKFVKFLKFDLNSKINFKLKFDALIHCAGSIPSDHLSLKKLKKINNLGFKKILSGTISSGCKKIILISSVSIYGDVKNKFLTEKYSSRNNLTSYAKTKLSMERDLINFSNVNNVSYLILRLPGLVGKNSKNNFISNLVNKIRNNQDLTINNPDFKFNNFIHVKNICSIVLKYLSSKKNNYIFNLGTIYPLKIANIVSFLKKGLKKNIRVKIKKKRTNVFRILLNKQLLNNFDIFSTKKTLRLLLKDYIIL